MPAELAGDVHQREQRRTDHEGGRERRENAVAATSPTIRAAVQARGGKSTVMNPCRTRGSGPPRRDPGARRDRLVGDGQLDGPSVDARTDTDSLGSLHRDLNE